MTNDGGPAFPGEMDSSMGVFRMPGMTLRDWFAGQALAGLLACNAIYSESTSNRTALSADAYAHADAMLIARNPREG